MRFDQVMMKCQYFATSTAKRLRGQPKRCPSCSSARSQLAGRKYLVTELRRCLDCFLLYRYPLETEQESRDFYQSGYSQGFTTDVPSALQLRPLLESGFKNHGKDYSSYIGVLKALGAAPRAKLIDFGCSWGYGTWQLQRAGYAVKGYEISDVRAEYGRKRLGVSIVHRVEDLESDVDVFFTAHVLEHVASVSSVILLARRLLRRGGIFVAFTPNGSEAFKARKPDAYRRLWGRVHPNLLDEKFYANQFGSQPLLVASSAYEFDRISAWDKVSPLMLDLSGDELLVAALM